MLRRNGTFSRMQWLVVVVLTLLLSLQGCAVVNTGEFGHGFMAYNDSDSAIYDVTILYGSQTIRYKKLYEKRIHGQQEGVWSSVAEQMTIIWHTEKDGSEHRITIPLKDKISRANQLANWKIRFYGERIELWREDDTGPVNLHTMIIPRETTKVFP